MSATLPIKYTDHCFDPGTDPQNVTCPICKQELLNNIEEGFWVSECPHLEFVFSSESEEFHFQTNEFEKRISKVLDENEDLYFDSDYEEILGLAGYDEKLEVVMMEYGGTAFNPGYTDFFGIVDR